MSGVSLPKFRSKKYHRRSFWACDECKLRKKKCDGSQPCATCTLHGKGNKDCTYDSKTRPSQPPTHRIRELEEDVRSVRVLLTRLKDGLAGDTLAEVDSMLAKLRPAAEEPSQLSSPTATEKSNAEGLQSMLSGRDRNLRHGPRSNYHGAYSGPAVILSVVEFFQPLKADYVVPEILAMFDASYSVPLQGPPAVPVRALDLPEKTKILELLNVVLMQSHPFLQFLDARSLHTLIDEVFAPTSTDNAEMNDHAFKSFCHILVALGTLLSVTHHRRNGCEWALSTAKDHFTTSCRLLELSDHDDLTRLQINLCASVYLILLSHLSVAYSHVNLAAVCAIKQGLLPGRYSSFAQSLAHSPLHHRTILAMINIDLYLGTVLGLPHIVNHDLVGKPSEELPKSPIVTSNFVALSNILSTSSQSLEILQKNLFVSLLTASVIRNFNDSATQSRDDLSPNTGIDEAVLENAVRDLAHLSKDLGTSLSTVASGDNNLSPARSGVAKVELELALYWSQLSLHLPFLHYLRPLADGQALPDAASRSALTCLKVAVNVIVRCDALLLSLTESDTYSQVMHPSNWTCIYTLFLGVLALIFLISIHKGTSRPSEAWLKANTGICILAALRCSDGGAARCLAVIKQIVGQLNYTVDFDFDNIERNTRRVCEGQTKLPTLSNILDGSLTHRDWERISVNMDGHQSLGQAVMEQDPCSMSSADRMLAHAQGLHLKDDPRPHDGDDLC